MNKYTEKQTVRISEIQKNSLKIIESKGVNISKFIRIAIKEKIQRDWKIIRESKIKKSDCPF
jgi:translation initiation factor 2 gamma subunit (eIF-2gamma)